MKKIRLIALSILSSVFSLASCQDDVNGGLSQPIDENVFETYNGSSGSGSGSSSSDTAQSGEISSNESQATTEEEEPGEFVEEPQENEESIDITFPEQPVEEPVEEPVDVTTPEEPVEVDPNEPVDVEPNEPVDVEPEIPPEEEIYTGISAAYNACFKEEEGIYSFDGVIVGKAGTLSWVQKDGYGIEVYNYPIEGAEFGKTVSITSTMQLYSGIPETKSVSSAVVTGDGELPTPISVTSAASISAANINILANVETAVFKSKSRNWTQNATGTFVFLIGEDQISINFDRHGYDADKAAIINNAVAGETYALSNILTSSGNGIPTLAFAGETSSIVKTGDAPEDFVEPVTPTVSTTQTEDGILSSFVLNETMEFSIASEAITVTFSRGEGQNDPKWYSNGYRIYRRNTITVRGSGVKCIRFDWQKQGVRDFNSLTANVGIYVHPDGPGEGVWEGLEDEIVFTCGESGQLLLNTFSVLVESK